MALRRARGACMTSPSPEAAGPSSLERAAAAGFLPTVLFLAVPNAIILSNLAELAYPLPAVLGFAGAWLGATGLLALWWWRRPSRSAVAVRVVAGIGLCVMLWDGISGSTREVYNVNAQVALDLGALAGAMLLLLRCPVRVLVALLAAANGVLWCWNVGTHGLALWQTRTPPRAQHAAGMPSPTAGNVYHIVLDGFQSEAFDMLRSRNPACIPEELTYFPAFRTQYLLTRYSLANLLAGTTYRDRESMRGWEAAAVDAGLWARLAGAGWAVWLYPESVETRFADATAIKPSKELQSAALSALDIVDLWALNLLPRSVATLARRADTVPSVVAATTDVRMQQYSVTARLGLRNRTGGTVQAAGEFAYFSHLNFARFLRDEEGRPAQGQYVFVHAVMPHWPFVLDAGCGYTGQARGPVVDAYLDQAACALRLIRDLVARLRELERLDDALILVHGDHGAALPVGRILVAAAAVPPEERARIPHPPIGVLDLVAPTERMSREEARQRSAALLLARLPGLPPLAQREERAVMLDLAPTILAHAGLDRGDLPGIPLQSLSVADPRPLSVFVHGPFTFERRGVQDFVPVVSRFYEYAVRDDAWEEIGAVTTRP